MRSLVADVQDGDRRVLFFSGHGAPSPEESTDEHEDDKQDES